MIELMVTGNDDNLREVVRHPLKEVAETVGALLTRTQINVRSVRVCHHRRVVVHVVGDHDVS